MARVTIAMLQTEITQLRQLNADWAHQAGVDRQTISRLKAQIPAVSRTVNVTDFASRCKAYCEENGVRCVPQHIAREWRA